MNYLLDEMETVSGLHGFSKRMQVPEIPKGPPILNNIRIDNSVVGSLNTGTIGSIEVNISQLKTGGNDQASAALGNLTEKIAGADDIDAAKKNELLDQVAFLTEQAAEAAKDRRPGMIKAATETLAASANAVTSVAGAWQAAEPILRSLFGLS